MPDLPEADVRKLFIALLPQLKPLGLTGARQAVLSAGLSNLADAYWDPFFKNAQKSFLASDETSQRQALQILADEMMKSSQIDTGAVREQMARLGYDYVARAFVPVEMFDRRESAFVPPSSASELEKAMKRLVDGGITGAITSACGAVDNATRSVYRARNPKLGDPHGSKPNVPKRFGYDAVKLASAICALFDDLDGRVKPSHDDEGISTQ